VRDVEADCAKLFAAVGPMDEFDTVDDVVSRIKDLRREALGETVPETPSKEDQ
jgi:hypothetical protein